MKRSRRANQRRVHPLQDEIANIGEEVSSLGEKLGEHASEEARLAIKSIREGLDRIVDDAGDLTRASALELRETIQEHPFAAVFAGMGIGFMIAVMLRRN